MKKVIRLTEKDLHNIIKESVNNIFENNDIDFKILVTIKRLEHYCDCGNELINKESDNRNKLYMKGYLHGLEKALNVVKEELNYKA